MGMAGGGRSGSRTEFELPRGWHEIVDRVGHNTGAVLALATGRADQFLTEARMLNVERRGSQCPLTEAMAQVQSSVDQSQSAFDGFQAMSDREQAQLARLEANRARIEAHVQARLARVHFGEANFNPVVVQVPKIICPRVRVHIPSMPRIKVPAPTVHVEYSGPGPV
jgi:hypothetical protein